MTEELFEEELECFQSIATQTLLESGSELSEAVDEFFKTQLCSVGIVVIEASLDEEEQSGDE